MSTAKTTVVWLRDELRLHDNALLASAVEQSAPMLPVFCLDPRIYSGDAVATNVPGTMPKCGARRTKFTLECLTDLATSLAAAGSLLHIVRDSPATALANVVDELHAFDSEMQVEVVCSEGICPEEIDDEEQVERALEQRGASLRRLWEGTMYHRDDVNGLPGPLPDDVFTNWRVKVEKAKTPIRDELRLRTPLPSPPQGADWSKSTVPSLADLGYDEADAVVDMRGDFFAPVGGEKAALARLRRYVWDEDRLKSYFETRNGMRGQGYSTKLAPWLARGCISPRRVAHECRRYEMERGIKNKSTYWVVFELTWRDYFSFLSRKYGRRLFWPSGFKGIGGRTEAWLGADNAAFKAWCSGQTGAPLVDANMRELVATGFMSNRGRQNVASFLVLDLGVDWRLGAAFFETHLVDYTAPANWGNWHAAAGLSGGRVNHFNIVKQSRDYDHNADYIKLWCPELAKVPPPNCFEPHKLNEAEQTRFGCEIGRDYPNLRLPPRSRRPPTDRRDASSGSKARNQQRDDAGDGRWDKIGRGKEARKAQRDRDRRRKTSRVQHEWD